jgi:capsular polysaccharide export protein
MVDSALSENPDAQIYIKTHPDVLAGKKRGYLESHHADSRIQLIAQDICPLSLLEQVDKVYVVTSQMGFEALMLNKPVVCFGMPWYAGWGLTDDRHPDMEALRGRRNVKRTLEELFAAAYLQYARYIDPATGKSGTIFDVIDWLARNKEANDATRGELWCVGMSLWKRAIVRPFLESPSTRVRFVRSAAALARKTPCANARVVIWGIRNEKAVREAADAKGMPVCRMEDGFLRSVGLGSDLYRPVSLVLDRGGMYFDPASGSDLEILLATQALSEKDLQRAARFIQSYVSLRASKYNIAGKPLQLAAGGRRVLLVPGQVEDDASIQRGSPVIATNLALLRKVRENNPDAYIVYKPHPDVVAGNRRGAIGQALLNGLVDQCAPEANIIDCIEAADEVHTMTSLSGFEALLHGRVVHCYGGPFYAGWGLTVDHFPLPHRQRKLSIEELVFAALLTYPRYVLPGVSGLASAEHVLELLMAQASAPSAQVGQRGLKAWMGRKLRKARALAQMLRDRRRLVFAKA